MRSARRFALDGAWEAQARLRAQRRPAAPAAPQRTTVSDAGMHFIVSGTTRESVGGELARFAAEGAKVIAPPEQVGAKWMATFENRRASVRVNVEKLGMKTMVTASTREAVEAKVTELVSFGARIDQPIEETGGIWTAVLDEAS